MRANTEVASSGVGRKPSENPKATTLGLRVSAAELEAIDEVVEELRKQHPTIEYTRTDVIRGWMREAIARRAKHRK